MTTYKEFIQTIIDSRGQWNIPTGEYWEGHHIIPHCKGGTGNTRSQHKNIIWLYPREHYEAHRLLALENSTDWDIINAFHCIAHMAADTNKRIITAEEYEEARKIMSECLRNNYPYTIECIETGELFRSPADVQSKYPHIHSNHVGECCMGKRITTGGFHWRYYNCDIFTLKADHKKVSDLGPIRCIETDTIYNKVSDYCKDNLFLGYRIIECCKGLRCTVDKYHWEFLNSTYEPKKDKRYGKQVLCIETGVVYKSISDATIQTGIVNIKMVCNGRRKKAGGYSWKFI